MPLISHRRDPAGIEKPVFYEIPDNTNVLEWICNTFKSQDDLCGDLSCSFVLNGKEIFRSDHEEKDESILNINLSNNDHLIIINRPALSGTAWAIVQIVIAVVSVAVAVYTYMNMPDLGDGASAGSTSPNNMLSAGANSFRPDQAIPELFGTGVAYPDFMQPSYYYYEDNIKKQIGLLCLTVGEIDEANAVVNIGVTDIESIGDSTATFYGPDDTVPQDFLSVHTQSTEIDGQVLVAPDDESVIQTDLSIGCTWGVEVTPFGNYEYMDITIDTSTYVGESIADDLNLFERGWIYLRSGLLQNAAGTNTTYINGVFDIKRITENVGSVVIRTIGSINRGELYYSINDDAIIGQGNIYSQFGEGTDGTTVNYIGWYDLPGSEAEEIWINWKLPYGLRTAKSKAATMEVEFEIKDSADTIFTKTVSITKNTPTGQYITTKFTKDNTTGLTTSKFSFQCRRLTNVLDSDGAALEQVQIESVSSVTPYDGSGFGNTTKLLVQRKATLLSADQSGKKINVEYTRKLPSYDRTTGIYDETTLVATNSFADAAAYTLIAKGNETTDTVDLAELYAIYDGLSDPDLGEFSYTFDDAELSKGERVDNCCKVARVISYHDGYRWRFNRDEVKPIRSALFNRRCTKGNQAKQSWQPQRSDDSDSVRIIYVDPDSNTNAYIDRAFNTTTGVILNDETGINLKEITLAGCRNITQATNRADLEIRRLAYQRRSVTETTYRDAMFVELLDRVGWVDVNDVDVFDGEILAIDGNNYDTTERFEPIYEHSYFVFITDAEGYPSNTVQCIARSDTEFGFTATGISGAYTVTGDQQIGSRYFIADAEDLSASDFTLTSRTPNGEDGTVTVELAEYQPLMYEMD